MANPNSYAGQPLYGKDLCELMRRINALIEESGAVAYLREWGEYGNGDGEFYNVNGVAVYGSPVEVFTVEYRPVISRVQVFDAVGTFLRKWTVPAGPAIAAYGGEIYTSSIVGGASPTATNKISVYDLDGNDVRNWEWAVPDLKRFDLAGVWGIAISAGEVYVTDRGNYCVQVFDLYGNLQRLWGSEGGGNGEFSFPFGIMIYGDEVYVTDHGADRVQVFDLDGTYKRQFPTGADPTGIIGHDGEIYVCGSTGGGVRIYSPTGTYSRNLDIPPYAPYRIDHGWGIALRAHTFFVTDSHEDATCRVVVYGPVAEPIDWTAYQQMDHESIGEEPGDNALSEAFEGAGAQWVARHIIDMRDAIAMIVEAEYYINPATSNVYNWTFASADNLYHVALGDGSDYGMAGAGYGWKRDEETMIGSPLYDLDIGEIAECVAALEAADTPGGGT
jgi:hypothetical protein